MMYFANVRTLEELKKAYRELALANHPDRGGDLETMQAINAEYDKVFEQVKNIHVNKDGEMFTKETEETPEEFKNIIDQLLKMEGVEVEIIGCFVWLSGNTKPYKDQIKALGFRWSANKTI